MAGITRHSSVKQRHAGAMSAQCTAACKATQRVGDPSHRGTSPWRCASSQSPLRAHTGSWPLTKRLASSTSKSPMKQRSRRQRTRFSSGMQRAHASATAHSSPPASSLIRFGLVHVCMCVCACVRVCASESVRGQSLDCCGVGGGGGL